MTSALTRVQVTGDEQGNLRVSWRLSGDGPVELAIGPSPDAIDRDHPIARVENRTQVVLPAPGPGRHYVSLTPSGGSPVVAAERLLRLDGARNFRDLGGYPTADGGTTRWGMVFRSDAPHRLSPADLAVLAGADLRVGYDLRADEERDRAPANLSQSVRRAPLTIRGLAAWTKENSRRFGGDRNDPVPNDFHARMYQAMIETDADTFGRLVTDLAESGSLPALIHCTAGKDRTGVAVALLLSALGVDAATVLDDYELSAAYFTEPLLRRLRARSADADFDVERHRTLYGAPRYAMAATLTVLCARYGSVANYLTERAGVAPEALTELRVRLVQPPITAREPAARHR